MPEAAFAALVPPRVIAPGVQVLNWKDHYAPTINGKVPPSLDDYEMARSYCLSAAE